MIYTNEFRNLNLTTLALGSHPGILQSMLDYEFLIGKQKTSLVGTIQSKQNKKFLKLFWGNSEILIPTFDTVTEAKKYHPRVDLFINFNSGRRCFFSTKEFFEMYPEAIGGHIFAEDTPEKFAIELHELYGKEKIIAGPSGVGILIPQYLKLGAIGGIDINQLLRNRLYQRGSTAVVSASGGMANEIISILATRNRNISIAFAVGGDRFPINTITDTFLRLEADSETKYITYYGELGGSDEYEIVKLITEKKITKPIICYIAGIIDESFDKPAQFGHAKALAQNQDESARSKRTTLRNAGCLVGESFKDFIQLIETHIPEEPVTQQIDESRIHQLTKRKSTLFTSTISGENAEGYVFVGETIQNWVSNHSLSEMITTALLGKRPKSSKTTQFIEDVCKAFLDHGPQVSGGINTLVAARAGKDLVSSVVSGLLTIGPRFGGATNEAAKNWFTGVQDKIDPQNFVESFAKEHKIIEGIGHLKHKVGYPDPRVEFLSKYTNDLSDAKYYKFARNVENITTNKKANLILNLDGIVGALMLDILCVFEDYDTNQLEELIEIEFFNALFVISRNIGFTAHYLDQRRIDEGLLRLPRELVKLN